MLEPQLKVFEALGCRIEAGCPDLRAADEVFRTLRAHEFDLGLGELLDSSRAALKPSLVRNIEEGRRLSGTDVARATAARTQLHLAAVDFFSRYDVLLAPVSQVVPFPVEWEYPQSIVGQPQHTYLDWMRSAYLFSVLGAPALSVPAGFTPDGLPVGLQIVGPPRADMTVLQVGAAYEALTRHGQRRPAFNATTHPIP